VFDQAGLPVGLLLGEVGKERPGEPLVQETRHTFVTHPLDLVSEAVVGKLALLALVEVLDAGGCPHEDEPFDELGVARAR